MNSNATSERTKNSQDLSERYLRVPLVQIDAFADTLFEGNPAAVMPLPEWLPDAVLQQAAEENNLSETAFLVKNLPAEIQAPNLEYPAYHLRWFTPAVEVDLCGHATMAAASYLFDDEHPEATLLQFYTRSGWLLVERSADGQLTMDFPSEAPRPVDANPEIVEALGVPVVEALQATDLIYLVDDAQKVMDLKPDLSILAALPVRGTIVTASGDGTDYDFVSRWFGAEAGVSEDPVTGSAHCQLAPFWAERLGKSVMLARQVSERGGTVRVSYEGERTLLTGRCVRYMEGNANLPR